MQSQARESEPLEIPIESEQTRPILNRKRSEQRIHGGERQPARTRLAKDASGEHIGVVPTRLDKSPSRQQPRDLVHLASEALQNFGDSHAREHKLGARPNQPLQLITRAVRDQS